MRKLVNNIKVLPLLKHLRVLLCILMLIPLSHSLIFDSLELSVVDSIELIESDMESEIEEEEVDDEFTEIDFSKISSLVQNVLAARRIKYLYSNEYIRLTTPPPEII